MAVEDTVGGTMATVVARMVAVVMVVGAMVAHVGTEVVARMVGRVLQGGFTTQVGGSNEGGFGPLF